jgi:hypothetical protein
MIRFIKVHSEQQIADIAYLAQEIWQEHYLPIVGQEQIDYMLKKFQCERAIAKQLTDGYEYYSVTYDKRSAGYMAVISNVSDASLMISKIYVHLADRKQEQQAFHRVVLPNGLHEQWTDCSGYWGWFCDGRLQDGESHWITNSYNRCTESLA